MSEVAKLEVITQYGIGDRVVLRGGPSKRGKIHTIAPWYKGIDTIGIDYFVHWDGEETPSDQDSPFTYTWEDLEPEKVRHE